jgi:hypothetical protein
MPARSVVIQLQNGIGQAILPDHRKMVPGRQYTVDWDTFQKLSNSARQNIVQVVSVINDSTTTFNAALTDSANPNFNISTILTTTTTSAVNYNFAGQGFQGYDVNGNVGVGSNVGSTVSGAAVNNVIIGPAGERYMYVYNGSVTASGGQVLVWADYNNRIATVARPTLLVLQDGQGTSYIPATTVSGAVGTKQGQFAGVALATFSGSAYGWLQIDGVCPSVSVSGTVAIGNTVAVGVSGTGKVQAATNASVSSNGVVSGTALANNVFGTVLASGTTAGGYYVVDIRSTKAKKPYTRVLNKN